MTYIMIHPLSVTIVFNAHSNLQQNARKSYGRLPGSISSVGSASLEFQILWDFITNVCVSSFFTSDEALLGPHELGSRRLEFCSDQSCWPWVVGRAEPVSARSSSPGSWQFKLSLQSCITLNKCVLLSIIAHHISSYISGIMHLFGCKFSKP